MRTVIIEAEWDAQAKVWVATSEDVPGLATEAATVDALMFKLESMIPELLAANGALPEGVPDIPYELRSTGRAALHAHGSVQTRARARGILADYEVPNAAEESEATMQTHCWSYSKAQGYIVRDYRLMAIDCPHCESRAHRVPRRILDRLLSLIVPLRRYQCESRNCGWEGNLPVPRGKEHAGVNY